MVLWPNPKLKRKILAQVITQEVRQRNILLKWLKKISTIAEIVVQLKTVQDEFEVLNVENTKNLDIIGTLVTKIVVLEKEKKHNLEESQTDPEQIYVN